MRQGIDSATSLWTIPNGEFSLLQSDVASTCCPARTSRNGSKKVARETLTRLLKPTPFVLLPPSGRRSLNEIKKESSAHTRRIPGCPSRTFSPATFVSEDKDVYFDHRGLAITATPMLRHEPNSPEWMKRLGGAGIVLGASKMAARLIGDFLLVSGGGVLLEVVFGSDNNKASP